MKKKEKILIASLLVLMVAAIVGVSYAAFRFIGNGEKVNSITTGAITMKYTETNNTISLNNALPTTDKTGMVRLNQGEYFDFTVESSITGNANINYEISAKDITSTIAWGRATIPTTPIDGSNIKLYLTKLNDDGTEEGVMTPEVYREEDEPNISTGRPEAEMSLYTGSMSSSESNNYRLRMYVTEEYNPQGDGGSLRFAVQVNVYGKDEIKYVPLTTKKILEDNTLQVEKEKMFNYASNGNYAYQDNEASVILNDPSQVTTGLYQSKDLDGVSYYYRGAVENNNLQYGEYEEDYYVYKYNQNYFQSLKSCQEDYFGCDESNKVLLAHAGDKMYWKIVRVNGDGSLRLIYNGTSATPSNTDIASSWLIGIAPYNLQNDNPKYTGYTYDNGTDSFIKEEIDTWYKNTLGKSNYDKKIIGGRFCSDSSGYKLGSEYGFPVELFGENDYAYGSFDRLGQAFNNYAKDNKPTLKCPKTTENYGGSYRLKAGLITADELTMAGECAGVESNSYLYSGETGMFYWTMSPVSFFRDTADVFFEVSNGWSLTNVADSNPGIRPVINLMTNNGFTSGNGTASNPYVVTE